MDYLRRRQLIKGIINLSEELNKANGIDALMIIYEMENLVNDYDSYKKDKKWETQN